MWRAWIVAGMAVWLAASPARAQRRGAGTARSSASTPPVTKGSAPASESDARSGHDLPVLPRHGMMGAPGAAHDPLGPSRLGAHGEAATRGSYGESAPGSGQSYEPWKSGDRVRSVSSADVRAARQQQAPDLEWAEAGAGAPQLQPQTPYGMKAQASQQPPRR